jgi:hypothetical protein
MKKKSVKEAKTSGNPSYAGVEETLTQGMSLIYKPFLIEDKSSPQSLELAAPSAEVNAPGIIEEREGVHYINREILSPNPEIEKTLDPDLKTLVDSVIK